MLKTELYKTAVSGLAATLSTLKVLSPLKSFLPFFDIYLPFLIYFYLRGQKLIDMNLEERQYSRQIYHFLNIDEENKVGEKHTVLFKSLLSLLGEPT